jgi:hypothetical protein
MGAIRTYIGACEAFRVCFRSGEGASKLRVRRLRRWLEVLLDPVGRNDGEPGSYWTESFSTKRLPFPTAAEEVESGRILSNLAWIRDTTFDSSTKLAVDTTSTSERREARPCKGGRTRWTV